MVEVVFQVPAFVAAENTAGETQNHVKLVVVSALLRARNSDQISAGPVAALAALPAARRPELDPIFSLFCKLFECLLFLVPFV